MKVWVLGPSRVAARDGGAPVPPGSRRVCALLAGLALHRGAPVAPDVLVDLVWGEHPPSGAHGTLHTYVSGLRRALEPGLGPRERATVLVTTGHGYQLQVPAAAVDAGWFADEVRDGRARTAGLVSQLSGGDRTGWPSAAELTRVVERIDASLALWAGTPYADLGDHEAVVAPRAALSELRAAAGESRLLALLALDDHAAVLADVEPALAAQPLRERLWALQVVALYRANRQAEALAALRRVRALLADELGADPGDELTALERAVLAQDPRLRLERERVSGVGVTGPADLEIPGAPPAPVSPGHTVGREREHALLAGALAAAAGRPTFVQVVGEPGIGKSRLVDDLVTSAVATGFAVGVGRCAQDEGAPPMWPWRSALSALVPDGHDGMRLDEVEDGPAPERAFRTWQRLTERVRAASTAAGLLLVFEDLHWADTASLQALRHLIDTLTTGRLLVVLTRRSLPAPSGDLAALVETFARQGGIRLDLDGLSAAAAAELVAEVTGTPVPTHTVAGWVDRSGGNPFYLQELARAGGESLPASLREVIQARVRRLPAPTQDVLPLAAVLGRRFSVELLAAVADRDPDEVDDDLEPARAAGLLVDVPSAPDEEPMAFSHALARDAVEQSVTPGRLARLHARVAHWLESDPASQRLVRSERRIPELARHWLAAGPTHSDKAWRAAAAAADQARSLFAYEEATMLLGAAVAVQQRDPSGQDLDRYRLQRDRIVDALRAAQWPLTVESASDAIAVARRLDRPELVAAPAAALTTYSVWLPQDWMEVHLDVIEDLRWALGRLDPLDLTVRCQVMLTLAVALYYAQDSLAERAALVDEGVALARRTDDPGVLTWALHAGWIASWSPDHHQQRHAFSTEGVVTAQDAGDPDALAVMLLTHAADALEAADVDGWHRFAAAADELAERRRLPYVRFALTFMRLALAVMDDDDAAIELQAAELHRQGGQVVLPAARLHPYAHVIMRGVWRPEGLANAAESIVTAGGDWDVSWSVPVFILARTGRLEALRAYLAAHPYRGYNANWTTMLNLCGMAEAAGTLADHHLADRAARELRAYQGLVALSGISVVMGPVDGYLAIAEAVLGNRTHASALADGAEALARTGQLPLYVPWLRGHRARLGF